MGFAGLAEGNSLENALDALGKIFVPNYTPTPSGRQTNDFGSLTFRNPFYANLEAVRAKVDTQTYQITSFANMSSSEVYVAARNADPTGLAYRYALQALNPFVVIGADYTAHNPTGPDGGPLDLYDAQTGQGTWTFNALSDRAELLAKRLQFNLNNGGTVQTDTHYLDVQTGFEVGDISSTNEVIFGDDRIGDVWQGMQAMIVSMVVMAPTRSKAMGGVTILKVVSAMIRDSVGVQAMTSFSASRAVISCMVKPTTIA